MKNKKKKSNLWMVIPILVCPIVLTFICNDIALGFGLGILIAGVICVIGSCDGHWFELPPYPDELNVDAMPMIENYMKEFQALCAKKGSVLDEMEFMRTKIRPFYPVGQHWHFTHRRWEFDEPGVNYCINKKMMYMLHPVGQLWSPEYRQWLTPYQLKKKQKAKRREQRRAEFRRWEKEANRALTMGFGMAIGEGIFNDSGN
jgi:hypothetical protein